MRIVKTELSQDMKRVEIELFYDLHIGSKKCLYDNILKRIERVKNNPNVFAILGGDLINNSTKDSVGDVYGEPIPVDEQIRKVVSIFTPIKDKILLYVNGNHERRTYKQCGVDIGDKIAVMLGVDDRYDYTSCLLFLTYGHAVHGARNRTSDWKNLVTIYATHGDGNGGRTVGGKANGLERRGDIIDADIVITGHTHQPITFRKASYKIDRHSRTVKKFEQVFVNASSELDYEEYAERIGLRPSSNVSPIIVLDGHCQVIT